MVGQHFDNIWVYLKDITNKFDRPVDTLIQSNWHTGINITSIKPSGVKDNTYKFALTKFLLAKPSKTNF